MIAVKREERQTPASTRVSGENLCILAKARIKKIEPNAKRNAIEETAKGLKLFQALLLSVWTLPLLRIMMATFAPRTAAFETPKVDGDALGLSRQVCLIKPERAKEIPQIVPARTLGRRIFCLIRIAVDSPFPKRPKKESLNEREEEPKNKEKNAKTKKRNKNTKRKHLFFCLSFFNSFL